MVRPLTTPGFHPWLHRFAVLTAAATFVLLGAGGLVTSHGVGMAVPDWPNTYGYNLFFFPFSRWVGGVFYEHSHRLLASGVGLLTAVLALWLYGRTSRPLLRWTGTALTAAAAATLLAAPSRRADAFVLVATGGAALAGSWFWPRCEPSPRWLRRLGVVAFFAVVLQGVLGGLRVVLFKDQIGIFHAALAQLFFALTCALALFTSRWWQGAKPAAELRERAAAPAAPENPDRQAAEAEAPVRRLRLWFVLTTLLVLGQLILGATMRHQHAGLAIPDFPLAYGKLWPAMDAASVARYNQERMEVLDVNTITALQIGLQMVHRLAAVLIAGAAGYCAWLARRSLGRRTVSSRLSLGWMGLILLQALLGAATIWTDKAADVATAHVLGGALTLALGVMLSLTVWKESVVIAPPSRRAGASAAGAKDAQASPPRTEWEPVAGRERTPAIGLN